MSKMQGTYSPTRDFVLMALMLAKKGDFARSGKALIKAATADDANSVIEAMASENEELAGGNGDSAPVVARAKGLDALITAMEASGDSANDNDVPDVEELEADEADIDALLHDEDETVIETPDPDNQIDVDTDDDTLMEAAANRLSRTQRNLRRVLKRS